MSEQKKEFSYVCLAGFIFSVLPAVLFLLAFFDRRLPRAFTDVLPAAILLLPLAGLIISIIGLKYARIEDMRGKGFAIAGIALPGAGVTVVIAFFIVFFALTGSSGTSKEIRKNEMHSMGSIGKAVNTEYDVSQYKIPRDFDFKSLNITIREKELKTYAKTKLDKIRKKSDKSIRGTYQDYNFIIVRSDRFNDWLASNCPSGEEYYFHEGYARIKYLDYWEIAATKYYDLAVFKDPSDKFVIITNCNDYKIISEFFG